MEKFDILKKTELEISHQYSRPRGTRKGAVGLWKDLSPARPPVFNNEFSLIKITEDWSLLLNFRTEESGDSSKNLMESLSLTKKLKQSLNAQWYLVQMQKNSDIIGEIGIVPFTIYGFKLGRLQNVEIAKKYQGQGFGNFLLNSIEIEALKMGLCAICLKADPENWPINWYKKIGYKEVGRW